MEKDHQLIRSGGGDNPSLLRSNSESIRQTASSPDFILQWGNRKRLRCMKVQSKDKNKADSVSLVHRTTSLLERRVLRPEKDSPIHPGSIQNNGYLNLRHRLPSPQPSPPPRILRNSEASGAMRSHSNGGVRGITSPEKANNHNISQNENNKSAVTSEIAGHDGRKGCSSFGTPSGELVAVAAPSVWPPKFVIALTNKEKEEDFLAIKGSKLSQRPKKRAKIIQRALNLVCPGGWLCDLTLERYEVREKKISKKRPRGLKAMGNMESESEY